MLYLIAALMGYFITINMRIERQGRRFIGTSLANPTARMLVSLGGLGGWFCILPAAYFVGSADGNGFLQGFLFCVASLVGGVVSAFLRAPGLSHLIAMSTVFLNVGLALLVYVLTRS